CLLPAIREPALRLRTGSVLRYFAGSRTHQRQPDAESVELDVFEQRILGGRHDYGCGVPWIWLLQPGPRLGLPDDRAAFLINYNLYGDVHGRLPGIRTPRVVYVQTCRRSDLQCG